MYVCMYVCMCIRLYLHVYLISPSRKAAVAFPGCMYVKERHAFSNGPHTFLNSPSIMS